ncbi:hypothetical protein MD484_g3527, partial [Candolleomyces efflorescens]
MVTVSHHDLRAFIVDHLKREFASQRGIPVIFAYCRYTEQYPASQFLAEWIRQLLEYDPTTLKYIKRMFTVHQRQDTSPSQAELHDLLSAICPAFEKVFIILDGLDEAQEDVKIQLLNEINTLPHNTRTLIMSRPLKSFEYLVPGAAHIDIEARNEDIELFVEKQIAQIPRLRTMLAKKDSEKRRICKAIKEKSGGMFLAASLQIDALKGSISPRALMSALEKLPTNINDLYRHTLKRIEAQSEPEVLLAKTTILWLLYALGSLSIKQLQHALAVDLELGIFDEDDIASEECIFDVCCGLISTPDPHDGLQCSDPLRLIHYTAHDFLKQECLSWFPAPHTLLSSTCVVYLSSPEYRHQIHEGLGFLPSNSLRPFLGYAYTYWSKHSRLSMQETGLSTYVSQFVSSPSTYLWRSGPYVDKLGPHHFAALYGLTDLLKGMPLSCEVTPKYRFTLLHLAAISGHVDSAKVVLERWPGMTIKDMSLDGRTPLMLATAAGHEGMTKFLLSMDPEDFETLNAMAACGCTALASAINSRRPKVVELLASSPGVSLAVQSCTRSPLSWAAFEGHIPLLRKCLSAPKVDVNEQHPFSGYTALCCTCRRNCPEAAEILLACEEVDIHLGPRCGCTPLLLAASINQLTIVSLLLSKPHINIHARCVHSGTALLAAKSDDMLKLLLTHKRILVNATADDIHICLALAARLGLEDSFSKLVHEALEPAGLSMHPRALFEAASRGHTAVVEIALRYVDIDTQALQGLTALDVAAEEGHTHTVSLLLSHNPLLSSRRKSETLLTACKNGMDELVKALLLQSDIDVNVEDEHECRPLTYAVWKDHSNICRMLLDHSKMHATCSSLLLHAASRGLENIVETLLTPAYELDVDVNAEDERGWTPLAHAVWENEPSIYLRLLAHPQIQLSAGKPSLLILAASKGRYDIVQLLLRPAHEQVIDINKEDEHGWTALACAARNNHLSICQMLLSHPEIQVCAGRVSPLVRAALYGRVQVVQTLLQPAYGMDATVTDQGWTILSAASFSGSTVLMQILLARDDIDVNLGTPPPLIVAVCKGHIEIVKILLAHSRTNVNVRDSGRHDQPSEPTALFYACHRGAPDIVQVLLQHPAIDVNSRLSRGVQRVSAPQSLEALWANISPPISLISGDCSTPLHAAVHRDKDNHEVVLLLLEVKDLDPNALNEGGKSALGFMLAGIKSYAVDKEDALVLKQMTLRFLAKPNAIWREPELLQSAARVGNIDIIKALLEHCDDKIDLTPALIAACQGRHTEVASILLDAPGTKFSSPGMALPIACRSGNDILVKDLLKHPKVDPNILTDHGYTALAEACYRGRADMISSLLSTDGIKVNTGKYHPLMLAVQVGHGRVVDLLIKGCPDIKVDQHAYKQEVVETLFSGPHFPLHPTYRQFRSMECWLRETGHIPRPGEPYRSPGCSGRLTQRAVNTYSIGLLNGPRERSRGDLIVAKNPAFGEGDPIFVYCTRVGNVRMSEAILSHHSVKINARARCGCTALIVGSFLRRHAILDRILDRTDTDPTICCPTHSTAVLAAAHRLYLDTVNKITSSSLRSKLDLNETASCGCNLFICAARSGDEDTFLSFLPLTNWQTSPNTVDCKFGRTALLWASVFGHESIIQLLLTNPVVDSNHRDKDGNNGLILAVESGRVEAVRELLAHPGIQINATNRNGDTALSLAVWHGCTTMIDLLLARWDVDLSVLPNLGRVSGNSASLTSQ